MNRQTDRWMDGQMDRQLQNLYKNFMTSPPPLTCIFWPPWVKNGGILPFFGPIFAILEDFLTSGRYLHNLLPSFNNFQSGMAAKWQLFFLNSKKGTKVACMFSCVVIQIFRPNFTYAKGLVKSGLHLVML